jgi:hypothetical protein
MVALLVATKDLMFFRLFAALLSVLILEHASAQTTLFASNETITQLSATKPWRQLLAYGQGTHSAITSPGFFLSPRGHIDPKAELEATLASFAAEPKNPDEHAQCRFPARYLWLDRQLNLQERGITPVACPKYQGFLKTDRIESPSLIFATGYLGNPASYYGHLLLKINTARNTKGTDLEDTAINFGANVPANENMLLYILKGIFGGYDSSFTDQQYFYHSHNYGESELRDLWEYQLNLDQDDLNLLTAHLWELLGADYTYYFFNRNCAYRMGDLLQLVIDEELVAPWRPWETPQAVMQRINKTRYKGHPVIKNLIYHPSRQSRLYQRYASLGKEERASVHQLVDQPQKISVSSVQGLPLDQQYKVVDTLIDYYQFVRKDKDGARDINNERYRQALSLRYQLPPGEGSQQFSSDNQPHLGRSPSYLNVGMSSNKSGDTAVNIWLRPAYYDALDADYGHIKNAALSMAEVTLGATENSLYIKDFSAVKIESIRQNYTSLPGDRHSSWYLDVGAQQAQLGCDDCLSTKLRSGYGYASNIVGDRLLMAGFVGGGFLGQSASSDHLYVSATAALNWHIAAGLTLHAEAEQRHFENERNLSVYRLQLRGQISQQTDVRAYFARDKEQESGISFGFYW